MAYSIDVKSITRAETYFGPFSFSK